MFAAIPHRHDGADAHRKKRFFRRNARLAKPSRHALSLVSPSRDEYMLGMGVLTPQSDKIYQYLNFDRIADFSGAAQTAVN